MCALQLELHKITAAIEQHVELDRRSAVTEKLCVHAKQLMPRIRARNRP